MGCCPQLNSPGARDLDSSLLAGELVIKKILDDMN
jgi:hypothetical protein